MDGMDITGTNGGIGDLVIGGMGGEADQPDGRGGRGGLSPGAEYLSGTHQPHMKRPYWGDGEPHFGRGADGPDTPQYHARRLIIELMKAEYLGANAYFTTAVWYERDAVPVDALNAMLAKAGHGWTVAIIDNEYAISEAGLP